MADEPNPGGSLDTATTTDVAASAAGTLPEARASSESQSSAATSDAAPAEQPSDASAPPAADLAALWKQLEAAPEEDARAWLKENPNHPLAKIQQADNSRAAQRARDEAKAEAERARIATAEAARLQQEADARAAREAEIDRLEELSEQGDYDATQQLAELTKGQRRRQRQLADPSLRKQAAQDILIASTMGVMQNEHWADVRPESLEKALTASWNTAETPADMFGRLKTADLQDKLARGLLVTSETHAALKTEFDTFKKEVETVKQAEYQRGRTEGLGGRPDPEMARGVGMHQNGAALTWESFNAKPLEERIRLRREQPELIDAMTRQLMS